VPAVVPSICELVLAELPAVRLDREELERMLDADEEARIPSRKATTIIARVCKKLGIDPKVIKQADLKPEQLTSLHNLIDLLERRTAPLRKS
jgi:hypothetical protein